jgi:hypothetical protein
MKGIEAAHLISGSDRAAGRREEAEVAGAGAGMASERVARGRQGSHFQALKLFRISDPIGSPNSGATLAELTEPRVSAPLCRRRLSRRCSRASSG